MRSRHVATTLAAITVGLTAASALHRRAGRRPAAAAVPAAPAVPAVDPAPVRDGVVLQFVRPVVPAPADQQPTAPARCGDSGGRTKAGAPCAARAAGGGRCHHHRMAA
ncbi:MAG: hypothetical protein M3Q22_11740 [Actinomycetota bacterium]|nr:hypothetical protein [Actinomycetota bacterium]